MDIRVPEAEFQIAKNNLGRSLINVYPGSTDEVVADFLDQTKLLNQVKRMARWFSLKAKALEVGSGYGLTLAYMRLKEGVEAFGIEPRILRISP